ncbi:cornifin-A-like [Chamaea fasciata]|uniref:cornifin-A-like n=1 Tax=Chamaea fasciata TaxID=190680 RepID=UPI00336A9AE0
MAAALPVGGSRWQRRPAAGTDADPAAAADRSRRGSNPLPQRRLHQPGHPSAVPRAGPPRPAPPRPSQADVGPVSVSPSVPQPCRGQARPSQADVGPVSVRLSVPQPCRGQARPSQADVGPVSVSPSVPQPCPPQPSPCRTHLPRWGSPRQGLGTRGPGCERKRGGLGCT